MKPTTFLILLALFTVRAFAQQKTIDSKITDVTVFMSGAELHHQASVSLKEGKQELTFGNLSPDLDGSTIVVNIDPKDVTILSVSHRINYLNNVQENPRIAIVRDSLQLVVDKLTMAGDKITVLETEKQMLFKNEGIGGTSQNVPTAEIEKAANFYRDRMNDLNEKLFKLKKERTDLQVTNNLLQRQLTELNAKYNPPSSEIALVVVSNKSQKADVSIKYQVAQAGWEPKYDVRSDGITKPVELTYRANVYNNCGLEWNNVKLKLSTADPKQGAEKPRLDAWDLAEDNTGYRNNQMAGFSNGYFDSEEENQQGLDNRLMEVAIAERNMDSKVVEKKNQKPQQQIEIVEVSELNAEFEIPQPYSILADAKPYIVEVTKYTLEAKYEHYAVPKVDNDAFLTAKVIGWNALNLVSGNASVYYNGAYLGNSYINTASVEDTLVLSLGRDSKIKLQRLKKSEENKKTVSGNSTKETLVFEITAKNNRDGAVSLTIEDQLPISSDTEIEVTANETSGAVLDKDSGKLTWKLNLAAGESQKLRLSYTIKCPKHRMLKQKSVRRSRAKY
ncbi:MAG: DUF4139 domain-containing protein [Flavobacteriales bacterium]